MTTAIAPSNSRGMGWRKPVPVFVPSPPNSRPTSDTFTPAPAFSGGDAFKQLTAEGPKDGLPPMPDDWPSIVRSFSQDFYHDSSRFRLAVGTTIPERQPVYAELSRTMSSTADYHRPHSSRSHYVQRAALPRIYRPPTPPKRSMRRPNSCAVPSMQEVQSSLGSPYRMIFPDPPSLYMDTSHRARRHSPPPSVCLSENTHIQASVRTKPSLQSLVPSEDHTAVSSHADTDSWYIHGYPQAGLDQQNGKKIAPGSKEVGGKSELPMHYIPASRLKKNKKRRSCSDIVWGTIVSAGRGIACVFEKDSVEPVSASEDKL